MSYDRERIARRLKSLRADKGWSQEDLANASGVPLNTIRSAETTRTGMNLDTAYKLTEALGCTLDVLVCRD
jgi:transcriptional regulator with XRE-family HTH domain